MCEERVSYIEKVRNYNYDKYDYNEICDYVRSDLNYIITRNSTCLNRIGIVKYKSKNTFAVEKLFSIYAIYSYGSGRYWIYTEEYGKINDSYLKVITNENLLDIDFIMQEIEYRLKKYMYPEKLIEDPKVHKIFVYGNAIINIIDLLRRDLFKEVSGYQDREDKYEVRDLEIIREDGENKKVAKVKLHPSFYLTEDNPYLHRCYNAHSNEAITRMILLDIIQILFTSDEVWVVDTGLTLNRVILFQEYLNEKENREIIIRKSENRDESDYVIIQKIDVLKTKDIGGIYRCNMHDEYKGSHCSFESPDFFKIIKEILKFFN